MSVIGGTKESAYVTRVADIQILSEDNMVRHFDYSGYLITAERQKDSAPETCYSRRSLRLPGVSKLRQRSIPTLPMVRP